MLRPNSNPSPVASALPYASHGFDDCLGEAVRRHCPPWLSHDSDDIGQTASVRLMMRLRDVPSLEASPAYVRRVAKNAVIDAVRSQTARQHRHRQAATVCRDTPASPEQQMMNRELGRALAEHLARLPDARRRAVALYMRGHGATEIAEQWGCATKRVENLLYRGLQSLRQSLTRAGFAPE